MLNDYQKKRDFQRTTEPVPSTKPGQGPLTFVIQKHAARRLHYDFRLELDGVLKSWAVPNGPSLDPRTKRLAVMVEDHPLDYASFSGTIPTGEYGAGQVEIWDSGLYVPDEGGQPIDERSLAEAALRKGLQDGKISVFLKGRRLNGSWALVKMKHTKNDWLLIKHQDQFARAGDLPPDEILPSAAPVQSPKVTPSFLDMAPKAPLPESISPMLASLGEKPFSDPRWIFEPKLDGYRILAFVRGGNLKLLSRNGLDVTAQYPFLVPALSGQQVKEMLLDGEMVALDQAGRPCFQCLQDHLQASTGKIASYKKGTLSRSSSSAEKSAGISIVYYVFDVLYLDGRDLRNLSLFQRKQILQAALLPSPHLRLVEYFDTDGETPYETFINFGLEGIMAKLKDSRYEDGHRSRSWLKIKAVNSDDFVIGGYTRGQGNRSKTFGALLLGSFNDQGQFIFNGHVGSGFDEATLVDLKQRLHKIEVPNSPFAEVPYLNSPAVWVRPELVAEVKFAERTKEGLLRIPIFLRLREDKSLSRATLPSGDPVSPNGKAPVVSLFDKKGLMEISKTSSSEILDQLKSPQNTFKLEVEGHPLNLTHLDKSLWPGTGHSQPFTKRDLLVYLSHASPYLLPHIRNRPITLSRYPDGINGEHFWQKHWNHPLPDFVETVPLSEESGVPRDYLLCNNLATLLWLGQQGNIDLHAWFSRVVLDPDDSLPDSRPDSVSHYPDFIIFDIDPYIYSGKEAKEAEPELNLRGFQQAGQAALWLKQVLDGLSLPAFVKTSGRTGLHIFVPLVRHFEFDAVHAAAKTISSYVLQQHPHEITMDWAVEKRSGKIFLDYNQNVRGKTLACIYSPRPSPEGTVSLPLRWDEIGQVFPTDFTLATAPARLEKVGDLWQSIFDRRADLSRFIQG